jgi:hypothetical protein
MAMDGARIISLGCRNVVMERLWAYRGTQLIFIDGKH